MKTKYYIYMFVAVIFLIGGCSNENDVTQDNMTDEKNNTSKVDDHSDNPFPLNIEIDGKEITIKKEPQKIIPLSLEVAEIVLELVDPSKVIAATRGLDDPYLSTKANISHEIPNRIAAASNIDPEEIISYETDLLLLTKMYGQEEDAEKILSQLDTPILSFDAMVTIDQFMNGVSQIGKAVGQETKAEELVTDMKTKISEIQQSIPENENPTVLALSEVGGDMGPFMMGPTNISYDLIQLAGATPAVDSIELERSTPASIEQILKMDPDYILLLDFFGKGEEGFENLIEDPGWDTLKAVEYDQIKMVDAKYILNPNVANVEGLKIITDWIYDLED